MCDVASNDFFCPFLLLHTLYNFQRFHDVAVSRFNSCRRDGGKKHFMRDNHERFSCIGKSVDTYDSYPQGCSFSPDGLCVLTSCKNVLRLYNTPANNDQAASLTTVLTAKGGDTVRSYDWYPYMKSSDPSTCCFVATSLDQPVHLYDAYTSSIRATYCPYNDKDEMESPQLVSFQPDGQKLVCGGFRTDRCLHLFDTNRPGKEGTLVKLGKTRRSTDGQKGHVSSLAFASSSNNNVLAVGTYSPGSIYIYDTRMATVAGSILQGLCVVGHGKSHARKKRRFPTDDDDNSNKDGQLLFTAVKVQWYHSRTRGGVTQLRFANNNHRLYSTSRRSDAVLAWDVRMLTDPTNATRPICGTNHYPTNNQTNQRMEFTLSDCERYLFVGGNDCCVRVYNTVTNQLVTTLDGLDDAANGVSYHSVHNGSLAVALGCRKFPSEDCYNDDDDHADALPPVLLQGGSISVYTVSSLDSGGSPTVVEP